mgnify:CR=1 FL=1
MLNVMTVNKLNELRLPAMAEAYREQMTDASCDALGFEERFGVMVDAEWGRRRNNRLTALVRKAGFQNSEACVENLEYHEDRKLDRGQIFRLASCDYIAQSQNIIVMGASGAGKTYVSCALGIAACRKFYAVRYIRLPDLLNELAVARGLGTFRKTIARYKKIRLLILDEWLLLPTSASEARDLLEIVEARYGVASTIFSSQFTPEGWHGKIGEEVLADAILDRIVHNAHSIMIGGKESMRKKKGIRIKE